MKNKPPFKTRAAAFARRMKNEISALLLYLKSGNTAPAAKIVAAIAVAYALSPIDLIPDFIPILGYLDDALVLPGLIWLAVRLIPPEEMQRCREAAGAKESGVKKRNWLYALPVAAIWALVLLAVFLKMRS